jgi:tryptophan-rich sensory protein
MQFKKQCVNSVKLAKGENISNIVYSHIYINVAHMQAAFCILLLGYALAVVCLVKEITWYHLVSKGRVS